MMGCGRKGTTKNGKKKLPNLSQGAFYNLLRKIYLITTILRVDISLLAIIRTK